MFLLFFSIFIICVLFSRISTGRFLTLEIDRLKSALCIQSSSEQHPPANLHLNTDVGPLRHQYRAGFGGSSRMFTFNFLNRLRPVIPNFHQLHGKQQAKSLQNLHYVYMRFCTEPSLKIRTYLASNTPT